MTLPIPAYVPVHLLRAQEPSYEWDDWDPASLVPRPSDHLVHRLNSISNYAGTAFAIGCAEWIVYSVARHLTNDLAFHYIDAFWFCCCSRDAVPPSETDETDWPSSYLGAVNLALMTVLNTIIESEFGPAGYYGALASGLALYVTVAKKEFLDWQAAALDRLAAAYPRSIEDPDGKVVPREILDPAVPLETLDTDSAARKLAQIIEASANPLMQEDEEDPDE